MIYADSNYARLSNANTFSSTQTFSSQVKVGNTLELNQNTSSQDFKVTGQSGKSLTLYVPNASNQQHSAALIDYEKIILSQRLSLGSNRISSVADPTDAQDAATKNYVDTHTGSGTNLLATNNTWTGINTFTEQNTTVQRQLAVNGTLKLGNVENTDISTDGAISFHWANNISSSPKAYILVAGAGTDTSGSKRYNI
jgi:hypothetical protein